MKLGYLLMETLYLDRAQHSYINYEITELGGAGFGLMSHREASLWDRERILENVGNADCNAADPPLAINDRALAWIPSTV